MKIFKKLAALAVIAGTLLFTGCGDMFAKKESAESFVVTPPFYMVKDEETGGVVYMLGAMHIGKEGAVYPQEIYAAIESSDVLVTEVDVQVLSADKDMADSARDELLCGEGRTARDYIGADYDYIIGRFREEKVYVQALEKYIPSMWSSQWSNNMARKCGYSSAYGTDNIMLTYAKAHGKPVEEMETAAGQFRVNADISEALQVYSLKNSVSLTLDETKEQYDRLYGAWKSFDEEGLIRLLTEDTETLPEELRDDQANYYDEMYVRRQRLMSDYILAKLRAGEKAFVMVGALHFVAAPSIRDNLAESGYKTEHLPMEKKVSP